MKIQLTNNLTLMKVHIALIGESGTGKTKLMATTGGKMLLLSVDKGELTLKDDKIHFVRATKWSEIVDFMKFITDKAKMAKHGFDWVGIDSLSSIEKILRDHLDDEGVDGFEKWNQYEKLIGGIMTTCRDSEHFNSITTFELEEKEDQNNLLKKKFALKGSLRDKVPYFYDFVFATKHIPAKNNKPEQYVIQTSKKNGFDFCKARGVDLKEYEPASISHIIKKLKKEKK